ncbi:MAG TPA: methyltransferase domain-containing protein, partial [Thermoleophilaceae bacterium]
PRCGSRARQRFLWRYLQRSGLVSESVRLLHVAPEAELARRLRHATDYVSADVDAGAAMVEADLTALPFAAGSFDLVLCSHVLEHVPDDAAAIAEIFRVLAAPGVALIQSPVNHEQALTYEDPGETDPDARLRRFSQADHVRVFGTDIRERLERPGFAVTIVSADDVDADEAKRYGLGRGAWPMRNDIYRCERT